MRAVEVSDIVKIEDLSHDGRGIARIDGKIVFVDGALPEERIRFVYTKKRKDYDEGRLHELITPAAERVKPACQHFGVCGGCTLQHLSPAGQLKYKQGHWLQLMKKMGGGLPDSVLPALQSDVWHYRRKARLGVKYVHKKERVLLGFREKNNAKYLLDMEECQILSKPVSQAIPEIKSLLNALPSGTQIAQIEVAIGDECALVFRNLVPLQDKDAELLREFAINSGFKIYLQPKGPDSLSLFYPPDANFSMQFSLEQFATQISFEPLDFIQVNKNMNELMVEQALKLLELQPDDRVLDLFCGLGNFTLPIARQVNYVYGIEGNAPMLERARINAQAQGITNLEFSVADLQDYNAVQALQTLQFNKVLIDPARDGAQTVVEALGASGVARIVYVSCHPATLARDAHILRTKYGYSMVCGGVMDMFPHTIHIESMALFVKG